MKRPSFAIATLVVSLLVLMGVVARFLEPIVPPPVANRLDKQASKFLHRAARQPIDWYPMGPEAFGEARRQAKPIVVVIGAVWSEWGRRMDESLFEDEEIARNLGRNFIAVRVDAIERPEFLSAYLPLSRLEEEILPGFQIYFLDPQGRLIQSLVRTSTLDRYGRAQFLAALTAAKEEYETALLNSARRTNPQAQQTQAIRRLAGSAFLPDFETYGENLEVALRPPKTTRRVVPRPLAYRYLLLTGRGDAMRRSVDAALLSPLVDWQDGGFFYLTTSDNRFVQFDKISVANADWLALLAYASALTGDRLYRDVALRTFDGLANDLTLDRHIAVCRVGDEEPNGRSRRSSINRGDLNALYTPGERLWLERNLTLNPWINPTMAPWIREPRVATESGTYLNGLLRRMSEASPQPPRVGDNRADAHGYSVARMVEAARILNDADRLAEASLRVDRLDAFRVENDVLSGPATDRSRHPYLGDYLSYSDAMLQDYLANGRVPSLEKGFVVLRRALFLFQGETRGEYLLATTMEQPGPADVLVPEIADNLRESCSAQLIRLCLAYGRLAESAEASKSLRDAAYAAIGLLTPSIGVASPRAAGFFLAAAAVRDDAYAIATGPLAVELASDTARRIPQRFVAPAIGPYRRDLQRRGEGIFIIRTGRIEGPYTPAQASRILARFDL